METVTQTHPNVVVVVMDTARYRDVFTAETTVAPTLESLATDGTKFKQAIAPAPWTLPSHASLFTGTYPSKHGAHADHKRLGDSPVLLPEAFAEEGYETVAVSNNTWISEEFGFGRGFERFYKTWQYVQSKTDLGRIARTYEGREKLTALARELFDGNPLVNLTNAVYGKYMRKQDDSGATHTNEWLRDWLSDRDDDRPFFLFVNYLEPHLEYRPPVKVARQFLPDDVSYEEAMTVSQDAWSYVAGKTEHSDRDFEILRALYRAEIAYLDERLDEFRDMLLENGVWDDTIFVVTSDHGENIGDHGLMDHQYCLYETLLHIPLIIHGGTFANGGVEERLVSLTDLVPTLLDAANLDGDSAVELRRQSQGTSVHPTVDTDGCRPEVFAEYLAPQPSMEALEQRVGSLPEGVTEFDRGLRAVRTNDHKLIRGSDGHRECYDLTTDPNETTNIVDKRPEKSSGLESNLDDWLGSFEHGRTAGEVTMSEEAKRRLEEMGYLQE